MIDTYLFAAILFTTFFTVLHSYRVGGKASETLHRVEINLPGRSLTLPVWTGEAIVALTVLAGCYTLDRLLPAAQVWQSPYLQFAFVAAALIAISMARAHAREVVAAVEDEDDRALVKASYKYYPIHGAAIFTLAFMLILKMLAGATANYITMDQTLDGFAAAHSALLAQAPTPLTDEVIQQVVALEVDLAAIRSDLFAQLEPFILLTFIAYAVNLLLISTPLKRAFQEGALATSNMLTLCFSVILCAAFALIFFTQFQQLVDGYVTTLLAVSGIETSSIEQAVTLSALVQTGLSQQGISGLLSALLQQGGLVLVLALILQKMLPSLMGTGEAKKPSDPDT